MEKISTLGWKHRERTAFVRPVSPNSWEVRRISLSAAGREGEWPRISCESREQACESARAWVQGGTVC